MEPRETIRFEFSTKDIREKLAIPSEEKIGVEIPDVPEKYKDPRMILAGFGGQGVLMLGVGLAQAGMQAGYHVSWIPSYGPEMRGGTANCHVNLSEHRIGSPLTSKPSVLVAMNLPSLDKFEDTVVPGGLIIYDSSLINRAPKRNDVQVVAIPATQMADTLGNTRAANKIILGAYIQFTGVLKKETLVSALPNFIKRKNLVPLNKLAIEKGIDFIKDNFT